MAHAVELESPARDFGQSDKKSLKRFLSVPQALYMLNSPLDIAIHNVNSVLGRQLNNLESIEEKIDLIYRSMLTRSQPVEKLNEFFRIMKLTEMKLPRIWFGLCNSRQFIFINGQITIVVDLFLPSLVFPQLIALGQKSQVHLLQNQINNSSISTWKGA